MSSAESVPGTWRRLHENSLAPVVVRRGPTYPLTVHLHQMLASEYCFCKIGHGKRGGKELAKTDISSKQTGLASWLGGPCRHTGLQRRKPLLLV